MEDKPLPVIGPSLYLDMMGTVWVLFILLKWVPLKLLPLGRRTMFSVFSMLGITEESSNGLYQGVDKRAYLRAT